MILFGHLGLTLAAARGADRLAGNNEYAFGRRIFDYRLVLLGSILPDILDKTMIFYISGEKLKSGRLFGHSLLFAVLLFVLGLVIWKGFKKSGALVLAACTFFHQLLDSMWNQLNIYLWPVYDFTLLKVHGITRLWSGHLPQIPVPVALAGRVGIEWSIIRLLIHDPFITLSEVAGLAVLMHFSHKLYKQKRIKDFANTGAYLAEKV